MNMFKISTTNSNGIYGLKRKERGFCPVNSLVAVSVCLSTSSLVYTSLRTQQKIRKTLGTNGSAYKLKTKGTDIKPCTSELFIIAMLQICD